MGSRYANDARVTRSCYDYSLRRPIIKLVPLALATAAPVLRFVLAVRFVIVFPSNVALGRSFVARFGLGNGGFALVVFFSVQSIERGGCERYQQFLGLNLPSTTTIAAIY